MEMDTERMNKNVKLDSDTTTAKSTVRLATVRMDIRMSTLRMTKNIHRDTIMVKSRTG